jgi:DNA-binding transcriptional LysR family regulator
MDLEVMQYFQDAIGLGSIAKAAKANFISQPAVSMAIKKLEDELGGKLFLRSASGLELTSLGEKVLELSKEMSVIVAKVQGLKKSSQQAEHGSIRIAAVYSLGLFSLNDLSLQFMKKYPTISLSIHFLTNPQGIKALQKGEIDIFFAVKQSFSQDLQVVPVGKEPLVAIFAKTSPPALHIPKISLSELEGEPYIAFEKELPTQKIIEAGFKAAHMQFKPIYRFDNVELIKRAVQAGLGFAIVPFSTVRQEVLDGHLSIKKISNPELFREAIALVRKEKNTAPAIKTFLSLAKSSLFTFN